MGGFDTRTRPHPNISALSFSGARLSSVAHDQLMQMNGVRSAVLLQLDPWRKHTTHTELVCVV
jgi:hypothetical protein